MKPHLFIQSTDEGDYGRCFKCGFSIKNHIHPYSMDHQRNFEVKNDEQKETDPGSHSGSGIW